jgi:uncharacterized protein (TIGR02996 family)
MRYDRAAVKQLRQWRAARQRPRDAPRETSLANLLAAVLFAPANTAPRLAYADAVKQDDPDRCDFIHLQLAAGDGDRSARAAARQLQIRHGARWAGAIAAIVDAYDFERGFVGFVRVGGKRFLEIAPKLPTLVPVRSLKLTKLGKADFPAILTMPVLRQIRALDVSDNRLDDDDIEMLAAAPALAGLLELELSDNPFGGRGIRALAKLSNLTYVGAENTDAPLFVDVPDERAWDCMSPQIDVPPPVRCESRINEQMRHEFGPLRWLEI